MKIKIAWRNLLRNKRRSLIVLTSIVIGVVCLLLNDSLGNGMIMQMLNNQIDNHVSHIQIHSKGFNDNKVVTNYINDVDKIEKSLQSKEYVVAYSKRVVIPGLLNSPESSTGMYLIGIEHEKEAEITSIKSHVIEGTYLTGKPNEILLGQKMVEKLEVGLGDKVIAVAADVDGDVSYELFRVQGIYDTHSSDFDKMYAYVSLSGSQKMLGLGNNVNEFAIITDNPDKTFDYQTEIIDDTGNDYEVLTYQELLPLMMTYLDVYKQSIVVFYLIIGIAIMFGIINTMLMSVMERIQEIGVLMSIGMKNGKIFMMIIQEAFILGVVGTLIGFVLGLLIFWPLSNSGIDLSMFSESLDSFGVSSIIYPILNMQVIMFSLFIMPIITVVGAIYPAFKAIRLQPTEAMRHV